MMPEAWTQQRPGTNRLGGRTRTHTPSPAVKTQISRIVRLNLRAGRISGTRESKTYVYVVMTKGAYAYHKDRGCRTINRRNVGPIVVQRLSLAKGSRDACEVCTDSAGSKDAKAK
jgi:hypothetical protein